MTEEQPRGANDPSSERVSLVDSLRSGSLGALSRLPILGRFVGRSRDRAGQTFVQGWENELRKPTGKQRDRDRYEED